MKAITTLILVFSTVGFVGCASRSAPSPTARNAAIGAATGAAIGGIIGHQSDETGEGAAIGAAVGGIAGAAVGNQQERRERERELEIARDRAAGRDLSRDSDEYYRSLLTTDEMETLRARARASGRTNYDLTDFLTEEEKANLRRRDQASREIGGAR